jgi:histidinol-phosphate phosphatase family protein
MKRRAIFLDRDGTIIEDVGHLRRPENVVFIPGAFEALRKVRDRFLLFIVTNQCGIGEGLISYAECEAVNCHVVNELKKQEIHIEAVYTCPHMKEDQCRCRKPGTYFLRKAGEDFGVDLSRSFVIGDHPHDVETAIRVGGRGIFVLTGHGRRHQTEIPSHYPTAASILEAVEMIMDQDGDTEN